MVVQYVIYVALYHSSLILYILYTDFLTIIFEALYQSVYHSASPKADIDSVT